MEEILEYFKPLFRKDEKVSGNVDFVKNNNLDKFKNIELRPDLKINEEEKAFCDRDISGFELFEALNQMETGKAPGSDGLSVGLYKAIWPLIEKPFLKSLQASIEKGELSKTQKEGIIRLIEKEGKDKELINNWRPITLINVDTKIFSKLLAMRFQKILDSVISNDQTGYRKGFFIGENIRLLKDLIEYCEQNEIDGNLIAIDFAKAFDSLSHEYLWLVMERAGFGEKYINFFKTLYKNSESAVMNGGNITEFFEISRSAKQGDCASPFLFILALEPLLQSIRNDIQIKGIKIGNYGEIKVSAYVDDCNAATKDNQSTQRLFELLKDFGELSGLKTNIEKTKGLKLGCGFPVTKEGDIEFQKFIKVLGVFLGEQSNELHENNLNYIINKMEKLINEWGCRDLSYLGKILISKSLILSQIIYKINVLECPVATVQRIQKMVNGFVWKGRSKVKNHLAYQDYKNGGFKLPDFAAINRAIDMVWIKRLLDNRNMKWKWFALLEIENFGNENFLIGRLPKKIYQKIKCSSFRANLKSWAENFPEPSNIFDWAPL